MVRSPTLLAIILIAACHDLAVASNDFGKTFLDRNQKQPGVITLDSGLQYRILRRGQGSIHPTKSTPCSCHYDGRTAENWPDGDKFDSSYDRGEPTVFAPNQVIKGWTEAMQLMVAGDKWELFIPSELAYGDRGMPPVIGGGDVLVFTLELLELQGARGSVTGPDLGITEVGSFDLDGWTVCIGLVVLATVLFIIIRCAPWQVHFSHKMDL